MADNDDDARPSLFAGDPLVHPDDDADADDAGEEEDDDDEASVVADVEAPRARPVDDDDDDVPFAAERAGEVEHMSLRSRLRPTASRPETRVRRVHNEYRDGGGWLGLWPEEDGQCDDPDAHAPLHRGLRESTCGARQSSVTAVGEAAAANDDDAADAEEEPDRRSVREVLQKHLESFERGFVTLGDAFKAARRYDGHGGWVFKPGDVVEFRAVDMRWHLGLVIISTGNRGLDRARLKRRGRHSRSHATTTTTTTTTTITKRATKRATSAEDNAKSKDTPRREEKEEEAGKDDDPLPGGTNTEQDDDVQEEEEEDDEDKEATGTADFAVVSPGGVAAGFNRASGDRTSSDAPRPSNKVIKALFGPTPFRYQQQMLLEAEEFMVHRRSSPNDFQAVDWVAWAEFKWRTWLRDAENAEFRRFHDAEVPCEGARVALHELVLEPFRLIEEINREWKIETTHLSPYLYFACLGSGLVVCLICLLIQVGGAVVLFRFRLQTTRHSDEGRAEWAREEGMYPCRVGSDRGPALSRMMVFLVALYYAAKVVPDQLDQILGVSGFRPGTGLAKLVALRRLISISNEDSLTMKLGLRIYLTLNTSFDCLTYALNLYLLYTERDALEVLLNSLAIEFIRTIDESFCASSWWDPEGRYIKASAVEMVLRQFLDIHAIEDRFFRSSSKDADKDKVPGPPGYYASRAAREDSSQRDGAQQPAAPRGSWRNSLLFSERSWSSAVDSGADGGPVGRFVRRRRLKEESLLFFRRFSTSRTRSKDASEQQTQGAAAPTQTNTAAEVAAARKAFVDSHLDAQMRKFYGDDQLKDARGASSTGLCAWLWSLVAFAGFQSLILGRYKRRVFQRWHRYHDFDRWHWETLDFRRATHVARVNRAFDEVVLSYGHVPGFPSAQAALGSRRRFKFASLCHKYPGSAHLIIAASGYKLACALLDANPYSGQYYDTPTPDASLPLICGGIAWLSPRGLRWVANVLDALIEFANTWVVVVFPFCIFTAVVYFPLCY